MTTATADNGGLLARSQPPRASMMGAMVAEPDRQAAADVLRNLAERVIAGELEGKRAAPFLLGLAAGLEAELLMNGDGDSESGDPPASSAE